MSSGTAAPGTSPSCTAGRVPAALNSQSATVRVRLAGSDSR
ncbi:hypothetical protein [Micromonospora orduensis]|nr:hypothetical protein [Micromonospora orduensis]